MNRHCTKCNYINATATGEAYEDCPHCNTIYSNLPEDRPTHLVDQYAKVMRDQTLYPAFRSWVKVNYFVWNLFAALSLIAGLAVLMIGRGESSVLGLLVGVFLAFFFHFLGKVSSELTIMLADMSDATVRVAAKLNQA
jgi:phage FluMu protein Com